MVAPPATGTSQAQHASTKPTPPARMNGGIVPNMAPPAFPYSARRAQPLDMNTVERKGQLSSRDPPPRPRIHDLLEAPTFCPTEAEFRDPMDYIRSISEKASKFGICKIIPPDNWNPEFAIDTERFHFRTRKQEINLVEGGNRTNLNYLDKLAQFHKQFGTQLNRFPSVNKGPLDLYKLKKAVEVRGGFDKVCKDKKWAEIGRDLGYSGKIMSSLSTSLKNSYQRWLHPYEEYLKQNKTGFSFHGEFDQNGSFSTAHGSHHQSPSVFPHPSQSAPPPAVNGSPAVKASAALQAAVNSPGHPPQLPQSQSAPAMAPRPSPSSGFTAVNTSGFAAVNAPSGFPAVNHATYNPIKIEPTSHAPSTPQHGFVPVNGCDAGSLQRHGSPLVNGLAKSNPLKRTLSHESLNGESGSDNAQFEGDQANGRRSKRPKKTSDVNGSLALRGSTPQAKTRSTPRRQGEKCELCGKTEDSSNVFVCDGCDLGYHRYCLDPPLGAFPDYDWHCPKCLVGNNEYGFEEGSIYSLKTFQDKANQFRDHYFAGRVPLDPLTNKPGKVTEEIVEKEFWNLVEDLENSVEVEYGADIHSTTHGSGFASIEKRPLDPYSRDPWNLNVLPFHEDSLFRHIKGDISGMTVPWLYVGMCFSTFCWHNEDHYAYSANYQHFGATKTWYGIPGKDALAFEAAMRQAVPELFESQPDLLFQLVTILPPNQLRKAGVDVYALDQRAGQFVITFPQAYHAGFNHGFNFNEAVNFAPPDWEPFGDAGVQRLQEFRRQPCFSHEELLFTAAASDTTIKTAKWLSAALVRTKDREFRNREYFANKHGIAYHRDVCNFERLDKEPNPDCGLIVKIQNEDLEEEEFQCQHCKAFSYLSQFRCATSNKVSCLLHTDVVDCCDESPEQRLRSPTHSVTFRYTNQELQSLVQKVVDKANVPQAWENKLEAMLDSEARPALKQMHTLLAEGEKIPAKLNGLDDLADFVKKCDQWVDEANLYLTRKQQNRRKNEKAWRRSSTRNSKNDEREPDNQLTLERMKELLEDGEQLGFSAPQFEALQEKLVGINEWRESVKGVFEARVQRTAEELEALLDEGKGLMVAMPELTNLENLTQRAQWGDQVEKARADMSSHSLDDCKALLKRSSDLNMPPGHPQAAFLNEMVQKGGFWEDKAKEVMTATDVHYPQLESLHNQVQAQNFPVNKDTLAQMDAILAKNREAKRQIITLVERSRDNDLRKRPMYAHVRDVLKDLESLNGKPHGTADLEKEIKRHEDWMRKGKKLFGKANAPLHILEQHMKAVEERNSFCFDLNDTFRPPIEPASREASPVDGQEKSGLNDEEKPVFCLCRQPEAGLMIECEICHDWYHAKCLKLARGRVKEVEMFTCPICDWRVKIPRDAARPKLEDLQAWAGEIADLPFQPEEEALLQRILDKAQAFRDFLSQYTNGNQLCRTPDEMPEMLFYLRKIEGAEVLLAYETNVFRQDLHKWQPIAPEPPQFLDQSLSTRKPRPTKQQKLMKEHGVEKPEDLPPHLRTKTYMRRKPTETYATGTLMPKPASDSASGPGSVNSPGQGGASGRSEPPSGTRPASNGSAPANGTYESGFISGAGASALFSGSYGPGGSSSYPDTTPSPMFSPGGSQPPDGLRDPITAGRGDREARDPAFPAFRHNAGLGIDGDDDLRAGLAGTSGEDATTPVEASSPQGGEIDDMFNQMTNHDDDEDGNEAATPSLGHDAGQAKEALEMIHGTDSDAGPDKDEGDNKVAESAEFAMESWTAAE